MYLEKTKQILNVMEEIRKFERSNIVSILQQKKEKAVRTKLCKPTLVLAFFFTASIVFKLLPGNSAKDLVKENLLLFY